MLSGTLGFIQHHVLTLPVLAKFALALAMIAVIPRLCRRVNVPAAVGLLLGGVIVGPYVLGFFGAERPIAEFVADIGNTNRRKPRLVRRACCGSEKYDSGVAW
jgi:hypothetical protein